MVLALSVVTFVATLLGGTFALRHRDRLHLILGLTAGVILGVVAFDLLPEIMNLSAETHTPFTEPMIGLACGFLGFHAIEKWLLVHSAHEGEYGGHHHPSVGVASALALAGHSFTDGLGIGLAFQVNHTVGFAVAIAVIGHDFADGLNTVSLMLTHGNTSRRASAYLLLDAIAPVLGAASTLLFSLSGHTLLIYLGVFAGFLLYIGASDVLPEAHADHPSLATLGLTVTGTVVMYLVISAMP